MSAAETFWTYYVFFCIAVLAVVCIIILIGEHYDYKDREKKARDIRWSTNRMKDY